MQIIIAPAKTFKKIDEKRLIPYKPLRFNKDTGKLVAHLQNYTQEALSEWMKVSHPIAVLNYKRYATFYDEEKVAYPALSYFEGEVYRAIDVESLGETSQHYLNQHLMILSGLYGIIHPQDKIQPYRLEMGSKLDGFEAQQLYKYWNIKLTSHVMQCLEKDLDEQILIQLASMEYSKVLDIKAIEKKYPVLHITFKESVADGKYRVVGMYAKKARGMMVRFLAENHIKNSQEIKKFNKEGYCFNEALSKEWEWVFTR